jgi:hypothetical protein
VISSALYFFGYIRASYTFGHYGVDLGLLRFSAQDYILRSGFAAFSPVVCLLLIYGFLVCIVEFRQLARAGRSRRHKATVGALEIAFSTFALSILGTSAAILRGQINPLAFLSIAVSAAALVAISRLTSNWPPKKLSLWLSLLPALIGMSVVLLFLGVYVQAASSGAAVAQNIDENLEARPSVLLYSDTNLAITDGQGVLTAEVQGAGEKYKFVTSGLKLLIYSGDRYFLMRSNPDRSPSEVLIVPSSSNVRLDVRARQATG